ncbi:MAG: hypothetical protein IJI05_05145 [Erysipelotrichaceae bacterium]|nr:hypothetical protein [Erysipelotrichaceae bacterium]
MRYAFSQVVINPQKPVKQAGFIQQVDPISEVHDDLHARILALDDDKRILVHVSCDLLGIRIDFQRQLAKDLAHCFDKPFDLVVSTTHTHFAGDTSNDEYYQQLYRQISAGIEALEFQSAETITVSWRHIPCDGVVGTSRISHHKANVVLGVAELKADGKKIGEIIYHNCHPTVMSGADTHFFSAEYPGYVLGKLSEKEPGQFFTYMQGSSGDISTRFTRSGQTYPCVEELGDRLVNKIAEAEAIAAEEQLLQLSFDSITIPCEHEFSEIHFDEIPDYATERELETIGYGKIMRQRLKDNPERLQKESTISAAGLGPVTFVFAPNELFSGYLKYVNLDKAALVCYSNGYSPYVTPIDEKLLTYETFTDTLTRETKQKVADAITRFGN